MYRGVLVEKDYVKLQMEFNENKCNVLHLGHSNRNYKMGSVGLQSPPLEKDLEVFVDDALKFRDRVSRAANKASRLLSLIRTTFSCIDEGTLPRLFTTLVRPHLECGNSIWHSWHQIEKLQIEKIQRQATKLIPTWNIYHTRKDYEPLNYHRWIPDVTMDTWSRYRRSWMG